jgi:mannan endo-1,4-beta-mannosidase
MRPRVIMLAALVLAALSVVIAAGRFNYKFSPPPPVHASLKPSLAAYLGVYEPGAPANYQNVEEFAKAAGRQPNLVGYFSGWAEPFATAFADTVREHGSTPFVQIDPTGASVASIAAGDYDDYLRSYAEAVRSFGKPVVIGFGHEMNAPWYMWGYGHVKPATFVAAWRHLVTLFRQAGADNVTWLWTIQADEQGTGPINDWWPGPQYVTWVGIDGFYYSPADTFTRVFGPTISQVHGLTGRPVLLSETAVGPGARQISNISKLFKGVAADHTLGLVWFDIKQDDGPYHQNWRIEGNSEAQLEFRLAISQYLEPAPAGD